MENNRTAGSDLFDETLQRSKKFGLSQSGLFKTSNASTFVVHVKNDAGRPLGTITEIPGANIITRTETVMQMTTPSGQVVFTAKTTTDALITLWQGTDGQYLGKIQFNTRSSSAALVAKNANEEILFRMGSNSGGLWGSFPEEFSLVANDVAIARIQRSDNGSEICLLNSGNCDSITKAFVLFAGYFLYRQYFAETSKGRTGIFGMSKFLDRLCTILLVAFICLTVLTLLIGGLKFT